VYLLVESATVLLEVVESMDASNSVEWNSDVENEASPAQKEVASEWEWGSVNGDGGGH
jgi:hypothetical protein